MAGIGSLAKKGAKALFDMSDARNVPDVPQFALERYDPPRGAPKGLASIMTPENARRLEEIARRGMDMGGPEWYYTVPLRERFIAELGPEEGPLAFRRFVDYVSATSPRAKVAENIRRGSYFYGRERQGLPVTVPKGDLPPGYGHLAHTSAHMASLRDLEGGGTFAALNRPKTSSFSENLWGNQEPLTIDTHNMKVVANVNRSPTAGEYGYLEQYQSEIADKLGLTPAQFQASLWVAGDTGVANAKPFLVVFDEVVERTAVRDKKSKDEVLKDFITGDAPLYGLGTLMSGLMVQDDKPVAEGMAAGGAVSAVARAIARLMEAGMPREVAERVVRGEMPPALSDRAPPRLTFSADNPKAIGAIPNILNFVDDPAYQILNKDLIPEMVMMSPDEYITEASRILSRQSPGEADFDNVVRSRTQDMEYLQGIQDLLDQGADFQVPFLDYKRGGQEGLHRAISARNLGEEQIPVMVMRSAKGDNFIPLTQAEQDAINAAKLEDLRAKGYPEPTVQKIMSDELSMNPESRQYRAYRQGKRQRLFHAGSPELATATELDPDAGRFGRSGSGVWMTPEPVLANTYVPPGVENAGTMYEFLVDDSKFPIFIGSGNWDEAAGGLYTPDYDPIIEDISGTTNEIARRVREMGYPGMKFTGISDVGPNYQAAKRSAEMIAPQYGMEPKELLDSTIGDRAVDDYDVYTIFDPSVARSPTAAFDPDQVGSPNLMAGLGPAAIGAGLIGAGMAPEEAEAAPFGTLARMLGKRTRETFHGSPHLFDQVDMSRMGSGEGTQFEGAGFYSAGARPTAESYQRDLAGYYGGSDAVEQRAYSDAFDLAEEYAGDRDPEDVLDEIMSSIADQDYERLPLELQGPAREIEARSRGALYRTEIPAEDLLDWDAPLAEQPENIRSAVMDTARAAKADAADPGAIDLEALPGMTGGDAYEQLRAVYGNGASAELNNRGVLGVQYFDAASREAGEGTRNYVVFDESNVNVVERNGEPVSALPRGRTAAGVAGLLGAGLLASPEEAEAAGFGTLARAIGRGTLRAYTGSAAKYATPSIQRVGTGEGNQAFGYGLYFSDSPQIAGGYRRGVSGGKVLERMSDRYTLDDLDLQSVDEMIDLGEFDPEDEKLMRALQDADYLGFDRPMEAVRAVFSPDINAFDPADPAVQKLQKIADEVGFLYEVEVPSENFIDWNLTLDEQPEVVRQVVTENVKDPKLRERIEDGTFRGSDAYYVFGNNPEVNSMMWAQYGVPGVRYNSFGRTIRGLDDARARKNAPQNYVVFDENLINIVRRNDEALENNFNEMAARASALDVRKPMAAVLGSGAAATQAAPGEPGFDFREASAQSLAQPREYTNLDRELARLMQLAAIRQQPSITPLRDTAMARAGDYLLEDRPSEMDALQRALQRLQMGQGIGEWLQATGQGDPTTVMQDLMAGLDIFDVATLLPGAGAAATRAVRRAGQ